MNSDEIKSIVKKKLGITVRGKLFFYTRDVSFNNRIHRFYIKSHRINYIRGGSLLENVYKIIELSQRCSTHYENGHIQCHYNARRSLKDIYKLYKSYFYDDTTIYDIMATLYRLVFIEKRLAVIRCSAVKKLVFWPNDSKNLNNKPINKEHKGEVGVPLKEWINLEEYV